MSTLRSGLIRLAHANPTLRKDLLPLLKKATVSPTIIRELSSQWVRGGREGRKFWTQKALESILGGLNAATFTEVDLQSFFSEFESDFAYAIMAVMDRHGEEGLAKGHRMGAVMEPTEG